ncbi:MAG: PAS domain S-box protein [Candidatus Auribacter fodinae]|jgi:PAS domain S-box-containing protein|uniref:histidine kinase n=1 Tax=Candidatus Auribacter fodinae TaxID=2093366 RepID=A0A3A4R9A7_9BACT|nr:MAG: PAS domain S-box protein [Candidatus Auribacter fodinae]
MSTATSLRNSFFWYFTISSFLLIGVIGFLSYFNISGRIRENVELKNNLLAHSLANDISSELSATLNQLTQLDRIIHNRAIIGISSINALLDTILAHSPSYESLFILNQSGKVEYLSLCENQKSKKTDFIDFDFSYLPVFKDAVDKKTPVWSDVFISVVTGKLSLSLALPCDQDVILATFNLTHIDSLIEKIQSGNDMVTLLLDNNGIMLYHPEETEAGQKISMRTLPPVQDALRKNFGTQLFAMNGLRCVGTTTQVPLTNWIILLAQTEKNAYAPVERLKPIFFITAGLAVLLSLLLAQVLSRRVTSSLAHLRIAASEASDARYSVTIPPQKYSELEELAKGFRIMNKAIEERERLLRQSREHYLTLFNGGCDAIFVAEINNNQQGIFIEVNQVACQKLGYTADELYDMTLTELCAASPEEQERLDLFHHYLLSKGSVLYEASIIAKDNTLIPVEIHSHLITIYGNRAVLSVARDITQRKLAEQALVESLSVLEAIFNSTADAILVLDTDTDTIHANPSFTAMFGCSDLQLDTLTHNDILMMISSKLHPEEPYRNTLIQLLNSTNECRNSITLADGRSLEAFSSPLMRNTIPCGRVWSFRDTTERTRYAQEREELIAQLEQQNIELEQFTYTVSHDLKSPLITIEGFLKVIKADKSITLPPKVSDFIDRMLNAAGTMQTLLHNLLHLAKIGRINAKPECISVKNILNDIINLHEHRIKENNISLTFDDSFPIIFGDKDRLFEVFLNLIDNAIKFSRSMPSPAIHIGTRQDSGQCVFFVRDNGIGIDMKYRDKVFGLFDKLSVSSEGTGIGLAIVKRVIEHHGGHIWVESEGPGTGCTFCFTLSDDAFVQNEEKYNA